MVYRTLFLLFIILLMACSEQKEISTLVETGQTKEQIKQILGKPSEISNFKKTTEYIWGPEEEFWIEIPNGKMIEVWHYKVSNGQLNLYFIGKNNYLSYKAFIPNDVVYESEH